MDTGKPQVSSKDLDVWRGSRRGFSDCKRHVWKVWWTRRLKRIGGPNHGKRMPYEYLTCVNCQASKSRWKR